MILPDLLLTTRANQHWTFSGMDSIESCVDKKHFKSYPYHVNYVYNSRGFRDKEWPSSNELKNSIWCIGDSFTEGMGSPVEHTWPYLLQKQTNIKTINVSMDGASNTWIARKTVDILTQLSPKYIVIHWSYLNRREISQEEIWNKESNNCWQEIYSLLKESSWPDCCNIAESKKLPEHIQEKIKSHWVDPCYTEEERRRTDLFSTVEEDLQNLRNCINSINNANQSTTIIHSFIPEFAADKAEEIVNSVRSEMNITVISYFNKLDFARDHHHYDIKTATHFVNQLIKLI